MISPNLIRWGAFGAAIAGVAWALSGVVALVFAGKGPEDFTGTLYFYLFEGAHVIAEAGMLVALVGFHARQKPGYERLGTVSFVLAFVGTALMCLSGVLWVILLQAANTRFLTILWDLALLCFFVGLPLLSIATFRAKILPRWAGLLLMTHIPLLSVAVSFDSVGEMMLLFLTLVGLLWLALGYALWAGRDAPARQPSLVMPAAREDVKLCSLDALESQDL